jgi:hypothetical protein
MPLVTTRAAAAATATGDNADLGLSPASIIGADLPAMPALAIFCFDAGVDLFFLLDFWLSARTAAARIAALRAVDK